MLGRLKKQCPECRTHLTIGAAQRGLSNENTWPFQPSIASTFKCPQCELRLREAFWPAWFLIVPFIVFWTGGLTVMIAQLRGTPVSGDLIAVIALWAVPLLIGCAIAAGITHALAKPVNCGRF